MIYAGVGRVVNVDDGSVESGSVHDLLQDAELVHDVVIIVGRGIICGVSLPGIDDQVQKLWFRFFMMDMQVVVAIGRVARF